MEKEGGIETGKYELRIAKNPLDARGGVIEGVNLQMTRAIVTVFSEAAMEVFRGRLAMVCRANRGFSTRGGMAVCCV
jgi:hypothetical protein